MNKFKNSQGKYYTRQLFWEEWIELPTSTRTIEPLFTLYTDKEGLVNLGKAYVESEDPTGYKVSQELLDGYRMWTVLLQCSWFQAAKKLWDDELDAKLASKGLENMKELLKDGPPAQRAAAAKYFADKEYRKDKTTSRGRPTKDQVEKETKQIAAVSKQLADDLERIKVGGNL